MRFNPGIEYQTNQISDTRHIHHIELGAIQTANNIELFMYQLTIYSICAISLFIGLSMIIHALRSR